MRKQEIADVTVHVCWSSSTVPRTSTQAINNARKVKLSFSSFPSSVITFAGRTQPFPRIFRRSKSRESSASQSIVHKLSDITLERQRGTSQRRLVEKMHFSVSCLGILALAIALQPIRVYAAPHGVSNQFVYNSRSQYLNLYRHGVCSQMLDATLPNPSQTATVE